MSPTSTPYAAELRRLRGEVLGLQEQKRDLERRNAFLVRELEEMQKKIPKRSQRREASGRLDQGDAVEVPMEDRSARTWIWMSLILQFFGYVFDAIWHGLLSPGVEPTTAGEMVRHLGTVHLPLYIGAASVLVSTSRALVRQARRSASGIAMTVAFAGAVLSAAAEAWHAYSHLRLDTHSAPIAGALSVIGFFVVVIAMAVSSGRWRRRTVD